jgi:membrane protease YdiL (CAAX protease family)
MQKEPFSAPYKSFLKQTEFGDSRWWTWLVGFWFAITMWFYGQIIFGIGLTIAAGASDPNGFNGMMESMAANQPADATDVTPALMFTFFAPVISFLLWVFRDQFDGNGRKIALGVAAFFAAASFSALVYVGINGSNANDAEMLNTWMARSPFVYLFMLLMFPPLAIGLWLVQKHVHRRTILSLHTAAKRFRWKRMFFSMGVFWAVAAALSYIAHSTGTSEAEFVFDASRFWKYLPITLLFIPLQSATEEIALRGYLNQGLGHFIKAPIIVFIITSAAFASLHLGNPEVAEGAKETSKLVVMSGYFFFGMFACLLSYIDGGLETAIGVHAANNMFAAAIVGYESSALPTPTIFRVGLNAQLDSITTVIGLGLVCLIMYMTRKSFARAENETTVF